MKNLIILLALTIVFDTSELFSGDYAAGNPAGGGGTEGNPYKIADVADLQKLMATTTDLDSYYILTSDINMSGQSADPIGSSSNAFTGTFNGQGFEIRNLSIDNFGTDYQALFAFIDQAKILNLGLVDANIKGLLYVAILVSQCTNSIIYNCYTTGYVEGYSYIGGISGKNEDNTTINKCYFSGNGVANDSRIGGISGYHKTSTIKNCHSTGIFYSNSYAGGICGYSFFGTIENCYSHANVSGIADIGGLSGYNRKSTLSICYSSGNVTGEYYTGGFCGYNADSYIKNCYSTTKTTGVEFTGGFCGLNFGTLPIECCHSIGETSGSLYTGGFCGDNNGAFSCCFWNTETSNQSNAVGRGAAAGITGMNSEQFSDQSLFETCLDFSSTWMMAGGYPVLTELTIPTLTQWAVILFIGLLAGVGGWFVWRRG